MLTLDTSDTIYSVSLPLHWRKKKQTLKVKNWKIFLVPFAIGGRRGKALKLKISDANLETAVKSLRVVKVKARRRALKKSDSN